MQADSDETLHDDSAALQARANILVDSISLLAKSQNEHIFRGVLLSYG
jgi:hypothetical protein